MSDERSGVATGDAFAGGGVHASRRRHAHRHPAEVGGTPDAPRSFSDRRERIGVADSGQFNCHLRKQVGSFVAGDERLVGTLEADAAMSTVRREPLVRLRSLRGAS